MYDQAVFTLKDSGIHDEEGEKTNGSNPLTAAQRRSGRILYFMMTVLPDQANTNCKYSLITCRACIQLPLYVYGIDASIDTHILKNTQTILVYLADLDNGRNPDIETLTKDRGDIFLECCAESFKEIFTLYVNELLFEMVKIALKDTYLGGTNPTALQKWGLYMPEMYYDRETRVMVNQSVHEFYTWFLFKIDALPQDVAFPLDIAANFFNKLSPNVREFLIS